MRNYLLLPISLLLAILNANFIAAQVPAAGKLVYEVERIVELNLGGQKMEQKMNTTQTIDFRDGYYRIAVTINQPVNGGGITLGQGGPAMLGYYVPEEKIIYQVNKLRGTEYAIKNRKREITEVQTTGNRDTLLGYPIQEFTCKYDGEPATGWYCESLPAHISPMGFVNLPGMIIRLRTPGTLLRLASVETGNPVSTKDLQVPEAAIKVTQEEFTKKISQ